MDFFYKDENGMKSFIFTLSSYKYLACVVTANSIALYSVSNVF
jgi:hypothetical protein